MLNQVNRNELLFILPTFSHFDYAKACLESLIHNTPPIYTVLIADDGSSDWDLNHFFNRYPCPLIIEHFPTNGGLTRSWNLGLQIAKDCKFKYTICGNSDLLFTEDWYPPLNSALNKFDLVGPITNAPGHATWQNIMPYHSETITDDREKLQQLARKVRQHTVSAKQCRYINGFCMLSKTETWWSGAFDADNVFNPAYKLAGNEDELQLRWYNLKRKFGYVPNSFVFHYRSVSRSEAIKQPASVGAYRPKHTGWDDSLQPVEHG